MLANNHVLDWGREGLAETLAALRAAGLRTAGAGDDADEASAPAEIELAQGGRVRSDFPAERLAAPAWVPGTAWSDQLSFWRAGYPAVMVTDTAYYRNRHYHCATDTPSRLRYPEMARVVEGLGAAVAAMVGEA